MVHDGHPDRPGRSLTPRAGRQGSLPEHGSGLGSRAVDAFPLGGSILILRASSSLRAYSKALYHILTVSSAEFQFQP